MTPTIWIDGKYYDKADAKISVFDHGLLYGDGVFEGIRVYNRRVFRLHQHLERLYASAKAAWIEIPMATDPLAQVIMLDPAGFVAEASGMNLFVVTNGTVKTPPAHSGILRGVTRDAVLDLAREATYGVEEVPLSRYDLYTANEVFLTGTAAEVIGVTKLDARVIGSGVPGPVTKELARRFKALATRGD